MRGIDLLLISFVRLVGATGLILGPLGGGLYGMSYMAEQYIRR